MSKKKKFGYSEYIEAVVKKEFKKPKKKSKSKRTQDEM